MAFDRIFGAALLCAALAGCAVGPDFHAPAAPQGVNVVRTLPAAKDLSAEGRSQVFGPDGALPGTWWQRLGNPGIDALVTTALEHNHGMAAARATLRASEDALRAGYGVFLPQVGAAVGVARQNGLFNAGHGLVSTGPYDTATVSASAGWVPDLFGGQRRAVEALAAGVDQQRAAALAVYQSLVADVVQAAIARAGYAAQRDATRAILRAEDDQVRLAQAQVDAGIAPWSAVLSLRAARAANAAALAALQQRLDQNEHLLALLCGAYPAQFTVPDIVLADITLPAQLPQALPSELVRQRPDILGAEAALHRASALIGVATADLFPSLTLGASGGMAHARAADLLHAGTRTWAAQATLAGSLFNGGSQWFTRKAAIDTYDAALAQYEQTVLAAFAQVADAMQALQNDAQVLQAQADARGAADANLAIARANFEAGSQGYLDLLAADAADSLANVAYSAAVAQRLEDTVALYAAVGGGWWSTDAPPQASLNDGAR